MPRNPEGNEPRRPPGVEPRRLDVITRRGIGIRRPRASYQDPLSALADHLKDLGQLNVTVSIPADDRGFVDRQCPSESCGHSFKVAEGASWEILTSGDSVWCPRCGRHDEMNCFNTEDQAEYIQKVAVQQLEQEMGEVLQRSSREWNRRQPRHGLIQMTFEYEPGEPTPIIPLVALDALNSDYNCPHCAVSFALIGAPHFCPGCGVQDKLKALRDHSDHCIGLVERFARFDEALGHKNPDDLYDIKYRMLRSAVKEVLGALEAGQKKVFTERYPSAGIRNGVFQRLDDADDLWRQHHGASLQDWLSASQYAHLKVMMARRHLLTHSDGTIDQGYLNQTGDAQFRVGERIQLLVDDVVALGAICQTILSHLETR